MSNIEQTMFEILSGEGVSRSVVSRISDQLHEDFEVWPKRDLSKEEILYLFLHGANRKAAGRSKTPGRRSFHIFRAKKSCLKYVYATMTVASRAGAGKLYLFA